MGKNRTYGKYIMCEYGQSKEKFRAYALMGIGEILRDNNARKLLKSFLRKGHITDESNAETLLECYIECEKILDNAHVCAKQMEKLIELCPTFHWEIKLIKNANQEMETRRKTISNLKNECIRNLECELDIERFYEYLLRKGQGINTNRIL